MSRINTAIEAIKPVLISFEAGPSVSIHTYIYIYPRYFKAISSESFGEKNFSIFFEDFDDFAFPSFVLLSFLFFSNEYCENFAQPLYFFTRERQISLLEF